MSVRILTGDCRDVLKTLPDQSVHCVVSSPPYYALRDYGVAGQIGLEPDYRAYIATMVDVFREIRRVLRADGTVWLNLGDSYATAPKGNSGYGTSTLTNEGAYQEEAPRPKWSGRPVPGSTARAGRGRGTKSKRPAMGKHEYLGDRIAIGPTSQPNRMPQPGLKPKDLVGIPWRVALALQDDGWWLRQDIIWAKPNPMPESVHDRCTKAHEYLFLLSKSGSTLLWHHRDGRWVYEKPSPDFIWRHRATGKETTTPHNHGDWIRINLWRGFDYYFDAPAIKEEAEYQPLIPPAGWMINKGSHSTIHPEGRTSYDERRAKRRTPKAKGEFSPDRKRNGEDGLAESFRAITGSRNRRSVWTISTQPFPEAHFATFPPALIEPCILAGCPAGGTVLDPFGGAGTTGLVADRLQRDAILIELNPEYAAMARRRIDGDAPLFSAVAAE